MKKQPQTSSPDAPGQPLYNSNGKEHGIIVGGGDRCTMEGCSGARVSVRWPDGSLTRPCSRGLIVRRDGALQIDHE